MLRGDANKEQVLALALHGNELAKPADVIRAPYIYGVVDNRD